MRTVKTLAVAIIMLLMSGCWDAHELDTLSIVTGVGVDVSEKPDEIHLVVQVGKTTRNLSAEEKSTQEKAFLLMEATGRSVLDALEMMNDRSSRTLYMDHNAVILFGRDQAEKGVKPYLDYFMRGEGMRMMVWVLVADNTAREILSAEPDPDKISAMTLSRMMETEARISDALTVDLQHFVSRIIDKTSSPVAPIVRTVEEEDGFRLELMGLAVFKGDRLVGQLDISLTQGYTWAMGIVKDSILNVRNDAGDAVLRVNELRCKPDTTMNEYNDVTVTLVLNGKLSIHEVYGFTDMDLQTVVSHLEEAAALEIEKQVVACFEKAKELNADIFGYGAAIHRKYPGQWRTLEAQWDQIFPSISLSIQINVTVTDTGKIANSLIMGNE